MAEKRRSGPVMSDPKAVKCEPDEEFLRQSGVSVLLRGALLKLVESRSEDPVGFLAEYFGHLSSEDDGGPEDVTVSRSLWHLSLVHHSQRSAFNNNVRVAYELLQNAPRGTGGVVYTEVLRGLCSEGGVSVATATPLLRRIQCHGYEVVPFELFRQSVLTCAVFVDYMRNSRCLYGAVARAPEGPPGGARAPEGPPGVASAPEGPPGGARAPEGPPGGARAPEGLCQAVLATLREALETADGAEVARYLEASAKISPAKVAQAMAEARPPSLQQEGPTMEAQEFEDAAAALFIARVRKVT